MGCLGVNFKEHIFIISGVLERHYHLFDGFTLLDRSARLLLEDKCSGVGGLWIPGFWVLDLGLVRAHLGALFLAAAISWHFRKRSRNIFTDHIVSSGKALCSGFNLAE